MGAEEKLSQSEERYRFLFNSIDEGFCVIEVLFDEGRPVDFRILEANPAFEEQTGLKDPVGRRARELISYIEERWLVAYGEVALSGQPRRFVDKMGALGRYLDVYAFRVGRPEERQVAILFKDVTSRRKAEEALRKLNVELEERVEQRTEQVRALASALSEAEEKERERIAYVLHDEVQQLLYGAELGLRTLRRHAEGLTKEGAREECYTLLDQLEEALDEAQEATRTLSVELSPPLLRGEGLAVAFEWLARHFEERYGLSVDLDLAKDFRLSDEALRRFLFQLIRELLFNVVKHAGAPKACVEGRRQGDRLVLYVYDEGKGFDKERVLRERAGRGLSVMQDRLDLLGGDMHVDAAPGEGTRVTISVPARDEEKG